MKKLTAIVMILVFSLGLFACADESYLAPTAVWCSGMRNLIARADGDTFAGDVESLLQYSEHAKSEIAQFDGITGEFLGCAMQLAGLMQNYTSFYDMTHFEQQAVLDAWYILANANCAKDAEEYSDIIESLARTWLDAYISSSSGITLPLAA